MFENFESFIRGIQMGLDAAQLKEQRGGHWNSLPYDKMKEDADYQKYQELVDEGERKVMNYIKARLGFQTDLY